MIPLGFLAATGYVNQIILSPFFIVLWVFPFGFPIIRCGNITLPLSKKKMTRKHLAYLYLSFLFWYMNTYNH